MPTKLRLLALLPLAVLAACGGGGGGGGKDTPTTTGPLAAYAGRFETNTSSEYSQILVHPLGQVVGSWSDRSSLSEVFAGAFAATGTTARAAGADFYAATHGTADVTLSQPDAGGAMTATITNTTIAAPAPTIKVTRTSVSPAFLGLPQEKLGGDYIDGETIPYRGQNAHVNAATGAMTGDYGTNCTITGTLTGYDNTVAMFLLDATFAGSGCAAQAVPTGTGHFVGYLASSRLGSLELVGVGTIAGTTATVMLKHSQRLGTY